MLGLCARGWQKCGLVPLRGAMLGASSTGRLICKLGLVYCDLGRALAESVPSTVPSAGEARGRRPGGLGAMRSRGLAKMGDTSPLPKVRMASASRGSANRCFSAALGILVLLECRICHPKICLFGIRIICKKLQTQEKL